MARTVELWGGPCDGAKVERADDRRRYAAAFWFTPWPDTEGTARWEQAAYTQDPDHSDRFKWVQT